MGRQNNSTVESEARQPESTRYVAVLGGPLQRHKLRCGRAKDFKTAVSRDQPG